MNAETVTFFVFAIPLVATALGVILSRSPMYAAMNLVAAFFFLAGIYVLLSAQLIAFMQILVYAGAVMVLFLFVIMLLSLGDERAQPERRKPIQYLGVLAAVALCATIVAVTAHIPQAMPGPLADPERFGTVKGVGQLLYTSFLLPFEVTSLLLLVAIVGAVVVAKERI